MSSRSFRLSIGVTALIIAVLMQVPQWIALQSPLANGFPVELNSDEDLYLSHVEEVLSGRPGQAAEAITGDSSVVPLQSAFLEQLIGSAFAWTNLRAAVVFQILDSIIPPLFFLTLIWFLRRCGFSRRMSFAGAILFFILELYSLNRPIHQRDSFLLVLLSLSCILESLRARPPPACRTGRDRRGRRWIGFIGGALLGVLVGVYFWSWTFAWTFFGLLFLVDLSEWMLGKWVLKEARSSLIRRTALWILQFIPPVRRLKDQVIVAADWQWLILYGALGAVVAIPFVLPMLEASSHPLYDSVMQRLELIPSRMLESPVRSALFALMAIGMSGAYISTYPLLKRYRGALVCTLAALIVLNQQLIHGVTFLFSSHYLFALVLAGVTTALVSILHVRSSRWLILSLAGSLIFLSGIAFDARQVIAQFQINPDRYTEHHLVSALPILDAMPRTTILSDAATMRFLLSHTHHDVPYNERLMYTLIADEELAERYCFTKLPLALKEWKIGSEPVLFYDPDRIVLNPDLRTEERSLATGTCVRMEKDPALFLQRYKIAYVLWNEKTEPVWDLNRLKVRLEKVMVGEGWSLWKVL